MKVISVGSPGIAYGKTEQGKTHFIHVCLLKMPLQRPSGYGIFKSFRDNMSKSIVIKPTDVFL